MEDMILVLDGYSDIVLEDDVPYVPKHDEYEGPYTVIPILNNDQVLETDSKLMTDNMTIKPIPVTYTTNPYNGKTVVIG